MFQFLIGTVQRYFIREGEANMNEKFPFLIGTVQRKLTDKEIKALKLKVSIPHRYSTTYETKFRIC